MANQENQAGTPMPGDDVRVQNAGTNTGSTALGNDATAPGGARKAGGASGPARGGAQNSPSNHGGELSSEQSNRQGEGQQSNKLLDTALESGKKWIEDSGVLNGVNQLPQSVKEWGSRAVTRVGDLSTTQKIVGGALLAVGIGFLATRKGKSSKTEARYTGGRQTSGSFGRSAGYQAPDATRRPGTGRSDSGSAYGNSGSRYGGSSDYNTGSGNYGSGSSYGSSTSQGTGSNTGGSAANSGSGFGASSAGGGDFSSPRTSESSQRSKGDDFRSIE